jgi:hypothetical protein
MFSSIETVLQKSIRSRHRFESGDHTQRPIVSTSLTPEMK